MPDSTLPPSKPQIKIVIHINPGTGNIDRMEGPLHMKQFMVGTLATAILMAVQHVPPAPILVPINGNNGKGNN